MDNYLYIIIIIGLTIFIVFYGGHNQQNKVEYDSKYFNNLNTIIYFEQKINKICQNNIFNKTNFININEYFDTTTILIPNFIDCFFIHIEPFHFFNIFNIVTKSSINTNMMIIFNHNNHNNLELVIDNHEHNLYNIDADKNILTESNLYFNKSESESESGSKSVYFYDLEKVISVVGIYHIYNNSNENIIITCFIVKKPFWHS